MKRFIAGAVCPKCNLMDKVFITYEHNVEVMACTKCGFKEARPQLVLTNQAASQDGIKKSSLIHKE